MAQQRVTVRVPAALRRLADDQAAVQVELAPEPPATVTAGQVLASLESSYPGVRDAALDERGAVRPHVNVFVGSENIRFCAGLATPVPAGAEVWILPAVSGGQGE
jgi:sulfur-carrier protein